ncbi:hypothetical protein CPB97_006957 [Podila verticillata]|nr:hypothetical protein CPB97_006957 [Podila verticillata]
MSSEPEKPVNPPASPPLDGTSTHYQPQQEPQVYKYVQPQQPTFAYTDAQPTATAIPVGSDRFMSKAPQLATCCMCIPLRAGALIISFLLFVYYCYMGISNLSHAINFFNYMSYRHDTTVAVVYLIFAVLFLSIAIAAAFGFVGIYQERLDRVRMFVRLYVVSVCIWILLEIIYVILNAVGRDYYADSYAYGVSMWAIWVAIFLVCLFFQIYFGCALVSYRRILQQRNETFDGTTPANGTYVAQDVAMA